MEGQPLPQALQPTSSREGHLGTVMILWLQVRTDHTQVNKSHPDEQLSSTYPSHNFHLIKHSYQSALNGHKQGIHTLLMHMAIA